MSDTDYTLDETLEAAWSRIQRRLRVEVGEDNFTSWFGRLVFEGLQGRAAVLSVPTPFIRNWLTSRYGDRIVNSFQSELPDVQAIEFRVRTHATNVERPRPNGGMPAARPQKSAQFASDSGHACQTGYPRQPALDDAFEGSPLDPRLTFDRFVIGTSNRLAHAAAVQVAESIASGPVRFNPLYLHSPTGLGKTHLMQAIAGTVAREKPHAQVLYLTSERFMYRFVEALRSRNALAFKDRLRCIDVLLIDDMQFLQGPSIQREFGHTLNALLNSGKQVVVAADHAPLEVESFDERMRSRLSSGLVVEIGSFDYELRRSILLQRATVEMSKDPTLDIPEPVIEYLASRLTTGGRELEGAILRVAAAHQLAEVPVTLEVAEHVVHELLRGKEPKRIRIDDILKALTQHFGISKGDLLSNRRSRSIVRPRQIGMFLAKHLTKRSLPEIGRRFGGRDHTTVLHAVRKIDTLIKQDSTLRQDVEILRRLLEE